ncbi:MAG: TonB-dependent receptor [Myxococcales bacterium]|nr:TonB-dependent receptor [Myxococcales bacterium]
MVSFVPQLSFLCLAGQAVAPAPAGTDAPPRRWLQPSYDVTVRAPPPPRSASESVRDRAALTTAPHRTADDLMRVVPGLFITQHGGEGKAFQLFYRGFDAVHGQDVEIWAGGVPVNDVSNIHGQGYADLHFLPAEVVEDVRSQGGPFDPRQGDFAVAGSLRFSLGLADPGLTTKVSAGAFDTQRLFVGYRPSAHDGRSFGAFEAFRTGGFGPSRSATRASAMGQQIVAVASNTELRLWVSAYAGRFDTAGVLSLSDLRARRVERFATYDDQQGGASTRMQALAELAYDVPGARGHLAFYAIDRGFRLRQNFTGFLTSAQGDAQAQTEDALTFGAHGAYRKRQPLLSPLDTVEAGFFVRTDGIEQLQQRVASLSGQVTATDVDARVQATDVAGYLDVVLHPLRPLTLRAGLRADGLAFSARERGETPARQTQGLFIGPRATLDLALGGGVHGLVSYGEGFRSPQARSLAQGQSVPFTEVQAVEAGLRAAGIWGSASAAVFGTRLSEDLVFDQTTARNERVPGTERVGATVDLTLRRGAWLLSNLGATYTRARFRQGDGRFEAGSLLPYVPQLVARWDLRFVHTFAPAPGRTLHAELGSGWSLLARRPLPFGEVGHDVFLVDLLARLRWNRIALGIELRNLLDRAWFDGEFVYAARWNATGAATLVPERFVTVGAPRSLMAELSLFL